MSRPRGRPRQDEQLDGVPGTVPGMGLRVTRRTKKTKMMGVLGLGNGFPRPVESEEPVVQNTLVEIPEECAKCGSAAITFARDIATPGPPRRVSCFTCGWNAFLVLPPLAPVLTIPTIERHKLGQRELIADPDAPPVRAARPRLEKTARPRKYVYKPEKPITDYTYGVEIRF